MRQEGTPTARERYRIVVWGEFGNLLSAAFDDVAVSTGDGQTVLTTSLRDPQELYGLLERLRDHGVRIEKVSHVDESN